MHHVLLILLIYNSKHCFNSPPVFYWPQSNTHIGQNRNRTGGVAPPFHSTTYTSITELKQE